MQKLKPKCSDSVFNFTKISQSFRKMGINAVKFQLGLKLKTLFVCVILNQLCLSLIIFGIKKICNNYFSTKTLRLRVNIPLLIFLKGFVLKNQKSLKRKVKLTLVKKIPLSFVTDPLWEKKFCGSTCNGQSVVCLYNRVFKKEVVSIWNGRLQFHSFFADENICLLNFEIICNQREHFNICSF